MALTVRNAEYFYIRIKDSPEKAYELLAQLASAEVSLLAFSAVPFGPNHLELTIFPTAAILLFSFRRNWAGWRPVRSMPFWFRETIISGLSRTSSGCSWRLMSTSTPRAVSPMAAGDMDT